MTAWSKLNQRIENCHRCSRLLDHCRRIASEKRRAYLDEEYWGRPVPNFGKANVPLLIVGLAPGAHGANRTGRMFTGDRSGDWLYRAMSRAGFCNQAESSSRQDGLKLTQCAITAVCHCAPPDNKPRSKEISNCNQFLKETIEICKPRVFLALGTLAWNALIRFAIESEWLPSPRPKFGHAQEIQIKTGRRNIWIIGCYHPSQQNTFTRRLTETMLDEVFANIRRLIDS